MPAVALLSYNVKTVLFDIFALQRKMQQSLVAVVCSWKKERMGGRGQIAIIT